MEFYKIETGISWWPLYQRRSLLFDSKAQVYGVLPRIMSAARRLNDGMGDYVANQIIKLMNKKGVLVKDSKILIWVLLLKKIVQM